MLVILGWAAIVILAAATTASAAHALGRRSGWTAPLFFLAAAFCAGSFLHPDAATLIAVAASAVILAAAGRLWTRKGLETLGSDLRDSISWMSRGIAARARSGGSPAAPPAGSPAAEVAEAVTARGIPSVAEDPHLGPMTEPGEIAAGPAQAPAPYVQLAEMIASFEPADDMELRAFMEGNAAGSVLVADAWHAFADTCLNGVGLDPGYVAGVLEAGDSSAGHGSLLAQVHKRFGVIYGAIQEWISGHGPLPKNAREFLSGEF